jgi:hypothetical protein
MRSSDLKLKDALHHAELLVRQDALHYFTGCYSQDAEVMPRVIQSLATYGKRKAFLHLHQIPHLAQTEATIDWAIQELLQTQVKNADSTYFDMLSDLVCEASLSLIVPRAQVIRNAPRFSQPGMQKLDDRLELASWDSERCWQELKRISAALAADNKPDYQAELVINALAERGESHVERILALLDQEATEADSGSMTYLEEYAIDLAGRMRLEETIPVIVKKMRESDEFTVSACVKALSRIGTDAAVDALTRDWDQTTPEYRIDASCTLHAIHTDLTVQRCLEFLPREKDISVKTWLADALLGQFAADAIEPVREMVRTRDYSEIASDLKSRIVAVSTVVGVSFPEYPVWKQHADQRLAKSERALREIEEFMQAPPAAVSERRADNAGKTSGSVRKQEHIGRNDPCPCGSGKKFKKCCLK